MHPPDSIDTLKERDALWHQLFLPGVICCRFDYFNGDDFCYYEVVWRNGRYKNGIYLCPYWHGSLGYHILCDRHGVDCCNHRRNRVAAGIAETLLNRLAQITVNCCCRMDSDNHCWIVPANAHRSNVTKKQKLYQVRFSVILRIFTKGRR
jgi:hypothetical protein